LEREGINRKKENKRFYYNTEYSYLGTHGNFHFADRPRQLVAVLIPVMKTAVVLNAKTENRNASLVSVFVSLFFLPFFL